MVSNPSQRRADQRHLSRSASSYAAFLESLQTHGFASRDEAEQAAVAVLCALEQRLSEEAGFKLESQLPSLLAELLIGCERPAQVSARDIGKQEFLMLVEERFSDPSRDAEDAAQRVFAAVAEQVSVGELHKLMQQLPEELRELWPEWIAAAHEHGPPTAPSREPELQLETAPKVVSDVLALPLNAQLGVLRSIAPRILARLEAKERHGFIRDLDTEISLALGGVPTYDVRHQS